MRIDDAAVSFLLRLLMFYYCMCHCSRHVCGLCLEDQQSLLLQFKNTLQFNSTKSTKLVSWNQSLACCDWSGVTCDEEGHVIGLHLSGEFIYGGLDNSSALFDLHYLQNLDLSGNHFNGSIPPAIKNLNNLTSLDLSYNGFVGQIPMEISQLTRLVSLHLRWSSSSYLKLEIPNLQKLVQNLTRIRQLYLDGVSISAQGQEWSNALLALADLEELRMSDCNLSGPINSSLSRLVNLSIIDLGGNNLSSIVPKSFADFKNLTSLSLAYCGLRGMFPQTIFQVPTLSSIDISGNEDLLCSFPNFPPNRSLRSLQVSNTKCFGVLPNSITNLLLLYELDLSNCHFNGTLPSVLSNCTQLEYLDLSYNNLIGKIPSFHMFNNLFFLDLSHNFLNGEVKLHMFGSLQYLTSLGFSYNNLSIDANAMDANLSSFPHLSTLKLASSKLTKFPMFLRNKSRIDELDLSNNHIQGLIPHWIWNRETIYNLNLSRNFLTSVEASFLNLTTKFQYLDFYSNQLQGQIPLFLGSNYLDYSNNNLNSVIPYGHGISTDFHFISLSNNNFRSSIPHFLCNVSISMLDLSNNKFQGTIPECLTSTVSDVLNLGNNSIGGHIPDTFPKSCNLSTLDLNGNQLSGLIPNSLANCMKLEVLDLGNNQINDLFPCSLNKISTLHVMALRTNKFHGPITCLHTNGTWPMLQIVDLAFNNFSGLLPAKEFNSWEAMMHTEDKVVSKSIQIPLIYGEHYWFSVIIINKGLEMKLVKILTIFTSIDFSSNNFEGPIPKELMNLKSLLVLNLSNNAFSGQIPSSIGNLKQLESLDLSNNSLTGEIPPQLASLTFLSYLNLSFNHLVGRIPTGTQIQSFEASSFIGNDGLYGPPLTNITNDGNPGLSPPPSDGDHDHTIDLNLIISVGLGVIFGFGMIIGPLFIWRKWRIRYWKLVDNILCSIFPQLHIEYQRRGGQLYTVLRWRH